MSKHRQEPHRAGKPVPGTRRATRRDPGPQGASPPPAATSAPAPVVKPAKPPTPAPKPKPAPKPAPKPVAKPAKPAKPAPAPRPAPKQASKPAAKPAAKPVKLPKPRTAAPSSARLGRPTAATYAKPQGGRSLLVVGVVVGFVFLVWVAWATWFHSTPSITSQLTGYQVNGEHDAVAQVDVSIDSGTTADCVVQALAADHSVVGEQHFSPHDGANTVPVRTERLATAVTLVGCTPGPDRP